MPTEPFMSRESTSPFIYRVWEAQFRTDGELHVTADGTWDMVFGQYRSHRECVITGPTIGPVTYAYHAGQWALGMQFREGIYIPGLPAREVINATRSLGGSDTTFTLQGFSFSMPTFDTVEEVVDKLWRQGLLARDVVVERALHAHDSSTPTRSVQRHFSDTTGITLSRHKQIKRAKEAAELLRQGEPIARVVHECGYYDQAHLNRSLKQFLGVTPQQLKNADS